MERWIGTLMRDKEKTYSDKGVLSVKGMTKNSFSKEFICYSAVISAKKSKWKEGETRECRFVFIGRNLDHKALQDGLMECMAEELDSMSEIPYMQRVGEFAEGKILKCWDQGNLYRVEIQNERKSNVWVPSTATTLCEVHFELEGAKLLTKRCMQWLLLRRIEKATKKSLCKNSNRFGKKS